MKLISKTILLFMLSECAHAHIIYGVAKIHDMQQHTMNKPVYVQTGSFSNLYAATEYQRHLKTKTIYTVFIKHSDNQYKVRVGPFYNYTTLKDFARRFSHGKSIKQPAVLRPVDMSTPVNPAAWFVNANVGGTKAGTGSSTTVDNGSGLASPYNQDIYNADGSDRSLLFGIQVGRHWEMDNPWLSAFSLGVQYQNVSTSNFSGQVIEFSLPEFTNYNYKWNMNSNLVLANAKLNLINYKRFSPYLNGGAGIVLNKANGYSESALSGVTPRVSPGYADNPSTQFGYILGAGIDYQLSPTLIVSAGYQYSNLGTANSGAGVDSWATQHLNFGSYQSNAFLLGFTYLFTMKTNTPYTK